MWSIAHTMRNVCLLLTCLWGAAEQANAQVVVEQGQGLAASSITVPQAQWGLADKYLLAYPHQTCGNLKSLRIEAHLDSGPDHAIADNQAFTLAQSVTVTVSSTGGQVTPSNFKANLTISQQQPEQIRLLDVSRFLGNNSAANDLTIRVSVPATATSTGTVPATSRIVVRCIPEYETYTATSLTITPATVAPVTGYEQTFRWASSCSLVGTYQLQILHRPVKVARINPSTSSTDDSYDPTASPSESEWNRTGLLIETGSANLFYKLSLTEGEGTYHWRVRAIGTQTGGVTNPSNWGPWANGTSFSVLAPDAASNWIYSRTFSEAGHVAEKLTFATGLQQVRQTQTRLATSTQSSVELGKQVVATQTLQDFSGRDAVTSLPIPLQDATADVLGFRPALLARTPGVPYEAAHFDQTDLTVPAQNTAREPLSAEEQGYYSRTNDRVADAEGYPFARTTYSNDGTNRVTEQGGVGGELRTRVSNSHTVKTSYASIAPAEVLRLFGQEAPQVDGLFKIITTDPNGVNSIVYQTKDQKTIATAVSGSSPTGASLLSLPSATGNTTTIKETITGTGQIISKILTLTEPTIISGSYGITPAQLQNACANYCSSCDYQILIRFIDVNAEPGSPPIFENPPILVRAADQCNAAYVDLGTGNTPMLPAGTYRIERELVPADTYPLAPNTAIAGPSTTTRTLAQHLDRLRTILTNNVTAGEPWTKINEYLDPATNNVAGLYTYLAGKPYAQEVHEGQLCYKIPIAGCAESIYFPLLTDYCPVPVDLTNPQFEQELQTVLTELNLLPENANNQQTAVGVLTAAGYETPGEFNTLVKNMAASPSYATPEQQKKIVDCWGGILAGLEATLYQATGQSAGYQFNIVRDYLQCTGIALTTPIANQANFDKTRAFEQFVYDPNNQAHQSCIRAVAVNDLTPTQALPAFTTVLSNFATYPLAKRNQVYQCLQNANTSSAGTPPTLTAQQALEQADNLMRKAREGCSNRRDEFKRIIVAQLHQGGQYVEGDTYVWTAGAGGVPIQTQTPRPAGTPYISFCELESLVQDMVEQCWSDCTLTLVYDPADPLKVIGVGTDDEQKKMNKALFSDLSVVVIGSDGSFTDPNNNWKPVPYSTQGSAIGSTSSAQQIVNALRLLTQGTNTLLGQPNRVTPKGCSSILNTVNEKRQNIFSLSTILNNTISTSVLSNNPDDPAYITFVDPRLNRTNYSYRVDNSPSGLLLDYSNYFVVTTDNDSNSNDACTSVSAITSFAPLTDEINVAGKHYYISFISFDRQRAFKKSEILNISDPYSDGNPSFGRYSNMSDDVRVDLLIQDPNTGLKNWQQARIYARGEGSPCSVIGGFQSDCTVGWRNVQNSCANTTRTQKLYYRWSPEPGGVVEAPTDGTPVFNPTPEPCNVTVARRLRLAFEQEQSQWIQGQLTAFSDHFQQQCVALATQQESLKLEYTLGYHHFTLYYYDRAGNLIKTVPPAGVVPFTSNEVATMLTTARNTWPVARHRLATTYTYNSLHQLEKQSSPDGGETRFYYNRKGQLRFSQNARQRTASLPAYSYTRYDELGRVTEVGESSTAAPSNGPVSAQQPTMLDYLEDMNFPPDDEVRQVTRTGYGNRFTIAYGTRPQRYLTNRVAYSYYDVDGNPGTLADNSYTYYSYDPHGNVEWLCQEQASLGRKFVRYEYDLISNKVTQVLYQENEADKFFHRYTYDADNRLTQVHTSANGVIWDQDARYSYFAHGPLKRLELGEDHVQGIDYTYTLQGWLKGINHPGQDPGQDGASTSLTATAKDAFGMSLGYFAGDFITNNAAWVNGAGSILQPQNSLYNGNIAAWTTSNRDDIPNPTPTAPQLGEQYRYDQLNRLTSSNAAYPNTTGNGFTATNDYATTYAYDPNGNLTTLTRNGAGRLGQLAMDQLSYTYDTGNNRDNRLLRVNDPTPNNSSYDDVKQNTSTSTQYGYDAIGNLTSDATNDVTNIEWNVHGKIARVARSTGQVTLYAYDAQGNRVRKTISTSNGTQLVHTYYVRDAQGNVLATYEQRTTNATAGTITLSEQPLYGSVRLGVYRPTGSTALPRLDLYNRLVGSKQYEITDHLGNVRALVGDTKRSDGSVAGAYKPDLLAYYNYYAFGQLQPGRYGPGNATGTGGYRYGYNGKEKDNNGELGLTSYDYGFRIYNPGIARFLSEDPLKSHYPMLTPYQFASNSPIQNIDIDGLEGFQYTLNVKLTDGSVVAMAKVVEVNVYVAVTQNTRSVMGYSVGDGGRLKGYLDQGFLNVRHKDGSTNFTDDSGLPVLFKFNISESNVAGAENVTELRVQYTNLLKDIQIKDNDNTVRRSILMGRLLPAVENKGGTGALYGGDFIGTAPGEVPGTTQSADMAVIHEIIHGFFSYNPNLVMGSDARRHNDPKLGGTGALRYGSNSQSNANSTNVGMILKTVPDVGETTVSEAEYNNTFAPLIKVKGQENE